MELVVGPPVLLSGGKAHRFEPYEEACMATRELEVRNGLDKADLLRAVANPDKHLHVSFETSGDLVEAHIDTIEVAFNIAMGGVIAASILPLLL